MSGENLRIWLVERCVDTRAVLRVRPLELDDMPPAPRFTVVARYELEAMNEAIRKYGSTGQFGIVNNLAYKQPT
jgi:hypothetical protein